MSMRLLILGATGHTGGLLLQQALQRGHKVTAYARSPTKLRPADGLSVVAGDLKHSDKLAAALMGHDAVLSALGPAPREALQPSTLLTDCMRTTLEAMNAAGVRRLIVVSAAVLFPERGLFFAFFRWLLRHHARDLRGMEQLVRESGCAYTLARPPRLVHTSEVGFRAVSEALPLGARVMSFAAVAAFMLDAVERGAHVGEVVGLGPALKEARRLPEARSVTGSGS